MARLQVRVQPRSSRNEIEPPGDNGTVRVRVTAPPADGKANEAVIRLLARRLGLPPSALEIVRGQTSRDKTIEIEELTDAELRRRL